VRRASVHSLLVLLVLVVVVSAPAAAAPTDARGGVNGFFRLRPDERKCPSPICGGWYAAPVNLGSAGYVAERDLSALNLSGAARARLEGELARGRAFLRGRIVAGGIAGFPDLARLVASEAWRAQTSAPASRAVYRLVDRGLRCPAAPCFSTHAARLNTTWHTNLSELDLSAIRPAALHERAQLAVIHGLLLASGRIRSVPDAGPAGDGRELAVAQVWFRAAGG
jgi:hypothetical protein